jgi:ribosomal protein L37AE/L43A
VDGRKDVAMTDPKCAVCGGPTVDEVGRIWGCEFCPNVFPRKRSLKIVKGKNA